MSSSTNQNLEYAKGGLTKSLHGIFYQLKLLMLFVIRGLNKQYAFKLATEMENIGQLDDLVFLYKQKNKHGSEGEKAIFLQAKHAHNDQETVTISQLLSKTDGDFCLQKYFTSYRKILKNPIIQKFNVKDEDMDFIICTNKTFRENNEVGGNELQLSGEIFMKENYNAGPLCTKFHKFKNEFRGKDKIKSELRNTSDLVRIAQVLAQYVFQKENKKKHNLLKLYQFALTNQDIVSKSGSKYKLGEKIVKKSQDTKHFRDAFFQACTKFDSNITWEQLQEKKIELFEEFGQRNLELQDMEEFTKWFVSLIKDSTSNIIKIVKKSQMAKNVDKLFGHVLIEENGEIKFNQNLNEKFPPDLHFKKLVRKLKAELRDRDFSNYTFTINNFPKLNLPTHPDKKLYDLANVLAQCVFKGSNEFKDQEKIKLFNSYQYALLEQNIISKCGSKYKLGENILFAQQCTEKLRNTFFEECKKYDSNIDWAQLKKKSFQILKNFGERNSRLQKIEDFTKRFISLMEQSSNHLVKINKVDNMAKNVDKLAGKVLIEKNNVIKFNPQFIRNENKNLNEDLVHFMKELKKSFHYKDLRKYVFEIHNFPRLNLPNDKVEETEIKGFFSFFRLAFNQKNEEELTQIIEGELGEFLGAGFNDTQRKNIYCRFKEELEIWMTKKNGTFFTDNDGMALLSKLQRECFIDEPCLVLNDIECPVS